MLMTKVTHPPRLADASTLVIESLNAFETPRKAWVYNPGTRRVRRAPDISYDYMPSSAQGLTTVDQFDGFNGAKDRYYWSDLGEQLRLMPYNAYKFHETKIEEILTPYHVNQDFLRYELVKVNVVEAILKEDKRHIIPKRIMYFDTDSHNMLSEETFDDMGIIMAYREFPIINFYDQPMCLSIHSATYDFATRRYQLQSVRSTDIPALDERYIGYANSSYKITRGKKTKLKVRNTTKLKESILNTTSPYVFENKNDQKVFEELAKKIKTVRLGGDCYSYCLLADGHVDIVLESGLKPWDIRALEPIILNAGGEIKTWEGKDILNGGRIIATTNKKLFNKARNILKNKNYPKKN